MLESDIRSMGEVRLISPRSYKLNNYNSSEDFLCNAQTSLRDLYIETPVNGLIRETGEEGREKIRVGVTDIAWSSL